MCLLSGNYVMVKVSYLLVPGLLDRFMPKYYFEKKKIFSKT